MASDSLPTPPSGHTPTPAAATAAAAASGSQSAADAPSLPVPVPPATATAATATGAPPAPPTLAETLESLLQQIVASNSPSALVATLRNAVGTSEAREEVLVSTTSTGADPLEALDVAQHTIGALFILYVGPPPPRFRGIWIGLLIETQVCTSHIRVNDRASCTVRVHR